MWSPQSYLGRIPSHPPAQDGVRYRPPHAWQRDGVLHVSSQAMHNSSSCNERMQIIAWYLLKFFFRPGHCPPRSVSPSSLLPSSKKGHARAGGVRTAQLSTLGLSVHAFSLATLSTCRGSSCQVIVGVECVSHGHVPCTADAQGNTGVGNVGWGNFGRDNIGSKNIGEPGWCQRFGPGGRTPRTALLHASAPGKGGGEG